ncbi:PREDICTED: putative FBD-associated F-box protein At1g61330 [Populus euphratica]|uniref:FBD-associated F-box protein At1g61330 n=1 Tax=Populus euphratica TaxID=75702 RepID=A0AAJ6V926_POPEU|nr:PREDICTED: putative FBD-associated F-box protein At1g61330 [Populus euphratica]
MASPERKSQTFLQISRKRLKRQCHSSYHHLDHANTSFTHVDHSVDLPDDVLDMIFSFLPIKKAMQIGILSTRFKNSWNFNRRLDFDNDFSRGRSPDDFKSIVNKVFDRHAGSRILSFRLCFDPNKEELLVEKWIRKSIEKGVEELNLELYQSGNVLEGRWPFKLNSDVYEAKSLKILKLSLCQLDLPPKLKGLHVLNTLVLRKIIITPTLIDNLFQNCFFLEILDLAHCHGIFHLKIFAQKTFKVLKVGDCQEILRIYIDAPNLRSFHYCGHVCFIKFNIVPQLKDVMLSFRPSKGFTETFRVRNLVYDLHPIQVLTTTSTFLEGLSPKFIGGKLREMQFFFGNLKEFHLIMEGAIYCNPHDIISFLKHCPSLEKIFIDLKDFCFVRGPYWELHNRQSFQKYSASFDCLKFIKLPGFKFQKDELMLVKFFLERAIFLEKLVLVTPKSRHARVPKPNLHAYYQYLQSWKASPGAQIAVFEHLNDTSVCPMHSKTWY